MADISDGANWSETDAANNRLSPNGWPEGMMPSGVNDTARADKGALKRFWNRANPITNITPSAGVWTFNTDNTAYPASYVAGELYCFRASGVSVGNDQFQVNALAPKPILKATGAGGTFAPILANDIAAYKPTYVVYDSTLASGAGAFILANPFVPLFGNGSGGTTLTGGLTVTGPILTQGNNAAFDFADENGTGATWSWYANGNQALLSNSGSGTMIKVDGSGNATALGSFTALGSGFNWFDINTGQEWQLVAHSGDAWLQTNNPGGWCLQFNPTDYSVGTNGALTVKGPITSANPAAAINFADQGGAGATWKWYAGGNAAILNNTGNGDRFKVDAVGATSVGSVTVLSGGYNWYDANDSSQEWQLVAHGNAAWFQTTVAGAWAMTISHVNLGITMAADLQVNGTAGKPGGGSWVDTSDARVKEDVRDYTAGLDAVLALRPVTYAFNGKGGTKRDGRRFVGLVADEVLPVMPEMIGTKSERLDPDDAEPTEIKTLDTTALAFALLNAVRELADRVGSLEERLAVRE